VNNVHALAGATRLAVAALTVCACSATNGTSLTAVPFTASDGSTASIGDFEGLPLVLNMWATNCVPCVKEMPALDKVATEQAGALRIIGVNVFDTPAKAAEFAADLGVSYSQFTDPDGELSTALLVTGLPATAFFDADGNLLDVHQGAYTADELRAAIAKHFATTDRTAPTSPTTGTTP